MCLLALLLSLLTIALLVLGLIGTPSERLWALLAGLSGNVSGSLFTLIQTGRKTPETPTEEPNKK